MSFKEQKSAFRLAMAVEGVPHWSKLSTPLEVPRQQLDEWQAKFWQPKAFSLIPAAPRLLNHFAVGADPEFSFFDSDGHKVNAENCGLQAGLAFGADNCGRIAELRPTASRFCLDTVASILAELRAMAEFVPECLKFHWRCGAYDGHDGLGGHVHFGRKRKHDQPNEVRALDNMMILMCAAGVFDAKEAAARASATPYGRRGDVRAQAHGYEYRSFPSWLASPLSAYVSLVLSKLAVVQPHLALAVRLDATQRVAQQTILNLLAYFKGRDDDAALALRGLQLHGFPPPQYTNDFRTPWGIGGAGSIKERILVAAPIPKGLVVPDMIAGREIERQQLFDYLSLARPIPTNPWNVWGFWKYYHQTKPPFFPLMRRTHTRVQPGIGELCWSIVGLEGAELVLSVGREGDYVYVSPYWAKRAPKLPEALSETLTDHAKVAVRSGGDYNGILFGKGVLAGPYVGRVRKVLTSGLLPLWEAGSETEAAAAEWAKKPPVEPKKLYGSIIAQI